MQLLPISKLKNKDNNPRTITDESFQKLCRNISDDPEFLSARPLLCYPKGDDYIVYAGNQRLKAIKHLGWKEAPCIVDEKISEELIHKRTILDNISAGTWDTELLTQEYSLEELEELGMAQEIIDEAYTTIENLGSTEEDEVTLEPGQDCDAQTKLGDLYELNGHRLICGDSTLPEYVKKVLSSAEPILMITDPPYGVEYDPSWRDAAGKGCRAKGKVQNDGQVNWSLAWHLFPGSVAYVWHAGKYCGEVEKSLTDCEYEMISQIIWVKQHFALSRGDYHWQHEPCWYAVKKGHQHNWQGARDQATTWEISNLNCFGKSKEEGEERTAHSTQKPIECMARPIRNNTSEGEGVYDPFLGSGTTLIAAEQLNRICYGIELSPAYCDIIVDRWKKFMIKSNKPFTIKKNGEVLNG